MLDRPPISPDLTNNALVGFRESYEKMQHKEKEHFMMFLMHFDGVLHSMIEGRQGNPIRCTHIHLPELDANIKSLLLEFISIRMFYGSMERDNEQDAYIERLLCNIKNKLLNNEAPVGASGSKGGNSIFKKWRASVAQLRQRLEFLESIPQEKSLWPDTILNIPSSSTDTFLESNFAITLDDLFKGSKRSYSLSNTDKSLMELVEILMKEERLTKIRKIILFDCEGKRLFKDFNRRMLLNMVEQNYLVTDLIIISFERKTFRLKKLISRLNSIYSEHLIAPQQELHFEDTYLFTKNEMGIVGKEKENVVQVKWVGEQSESFNDYLDLIRDLGLDKLRSISTLNIYSISVSQSVSNLIIKDLFRDDTRHGIFDDDLREEIHLLDQNERTHLRKVITNLLELVVYTWDNTKDLINKMYENQSVAIIVPYQLIGNSIFQGQLKQIFNLPNCNLYSWKDLRDENIEESTILILSYRDTGKFPFDIFPSILECGLIEGCFASAILFKTFFMRRYTQCMHSYMTTLEKLMENKFRFKNSESDRIKEMINQMKLTEQNDLLEADDRGYGLIEQSEAIRVEYNDKSHITIYPSKQLIVRKKGTSRYLVVRADAILEDFIEYEIQPLEEIHEDLNLFEITREEEEELLVIKKQFGVSDPNQALWKVQLARKAAEFIDTYSLYLSVKEIMGEGDKFIQYDYFKHNWLNPKSELLIPRKRKHFRIICEYLELSKAYYRLKLKKRSSLKDNSRQSNSRMNALLGQMINEGLFEKNVDWANLQMQHLMEIHELEEKGIVPEKLNSEMQALVELLSENIQLRTALKFELS